MLRRRKHISSDDDCVMRYSTIPPDSLMFEKLISSHAFNRMVSIFVPETMHMDESIHKIMKNGDCCGSNEFYVTEIPISALMERTFIEAFIKKGELTLVSYELESENEIVFGVRPDGILYLLIHFELFRQLGITDSNDVTIKKLEKDNKRLVTINLKSTTFSPVSKYYEKLYKRFQSLKYQVALIWKPDDENVCPISIKRHLEKENDVKCVPMDIKSHVFYNNRIPKLNKSSESFFKWFFYYMSLSEAMEDDHGNFKVPNFGSKMTESGQALTISWVGILPASNIVQLFSFLRNYIAERQDVPFIGLHVEGFQESPISFNDEPHRSHIYEANDISFILQNDGSTRFFDNPMCKFCFCKKKKSKETKCERELRELINTERVVIFSKASCPFCDDAKKIFRLMNSDYASIELDALSPKSGLIKALKERTGFFTVPQIFIDGNFIGGICELKALKNSGALQEMLCHVSPVCITTKSMRSNTGCYPMLPKQREGPCIMDCRAITAANNNSSRLTASTAYSRIPVPGQCKACSSI